MVRFLDRTTPPHILTLVLITGISALNMSIFLPSLAAMTDYFQTDYAIMQIALSGYLASTALLQVFIGPISDRFGRRKLLLGALAIFIVASFGAMMATTISNGFMSFTPCWRVAPPLVSWRGRAAFRSRGSAGGFRR